MKIKFFVLLMIFSITAILGQDSSQTFLSLKQTGVEEFIKQHPEYDGRGTIVFIFDTGIDMGIEGLTITSTGETKVIDVQDFTGQGELPVYEADTDEEDDVLYFVNEDKNMKVKGAGKLSLKSADDDYFIGVFDEKLLMNSGSRAADLNGNGSDEDKYFFVVFNTTEGYPVVYFDTDGDGDLSDEKPIRNYKENQDALFVANDRLVQLYMGLNIHLENKMVSFHFDDGGHGTHCAGIAAGNRIGENDFNGVAPGAYLISCKLGNNNYSGGATVTESMKKCFLYADKISKERKEPCVINMSFGVGSVIEGLSDIEKFIDDLVAENPYLYVCTSNGNEGPGISTAGLPSSSSSVLSSGAVLTKEVGGELYGATLEKDILLYFSSRGGEVSKPDVISPGACTSTVPNWDKRDRYWGTSMASPYSAGVVSLLMSAMAKEYPDTKIPSLLLFKALRESADKWDGYSHLDQGGGFVNVNKAYELLKQYIDSGEIEKFETYTIKAFSQTLPGNSGPNIYIRNGNFIESTDTYTVSVKRDNYINESKFYRIYNLESDSDWLKITQKKTYLRNDQGTMVTVTFDKAKMAKPGLYNGKVRAYRDDKSKFPEFEFMATVVIPYEFNNNNNYKLNETGTVEPGMFHRYYLNVPGGATTLKLTLATVNGKYASGKIRMHAPDGQEVYVSPTLSSDGENASVEKYLYDLQPGVYEVVVTGFYLAREASNYNLQAEFLSAQVTSSPEITAENSYIELTNYLGYKGRYSLSGEVEGFQKPHIIKIDGEVIYDLPFEIKPGEASKTFDISLSREDFNKVTDFAVMINDETGKSLEIGGLSYNEGSISIDNSFGDETKKLKLVIVPAFANAGGKMTININEKTALASATSITGKSSSRSIDLYPSIPEKINLIVEQPAYEIPANAVYYGEIKLTRNKGNDSDFRIPLTFKF